MRADLARKGSSDRAVVEIEFSVSNCGLGIVYGRLCCIFFGHSLIEIFRRDDIL